ncbi:MAG: hypothetical protein LBK50_02100 [Candidatus Nomurabacteria bacterium]|nr:hypothetical protein [Candidatus Nomurabacteria bacterium]
MLKIYQNYEEFRKGFTEILKSEALLMYSSGGAAGENGAVFVFWQTDDGHDISEIYEWNEFREGMNWSAKKVEVKNDNAIQKVKDFIDERKLVSEKLNGDEGVLDAWGSVVVNYNGEHREIKNNFSLQDEVADLLREIIKS